MHDYKLNGDELYGTHLTESIPFLNIFNQNRLYFGTWSKMQPFKNIETVEHRLTDHSGIKLEIN